MASNAWQRWSTIRSTALDEIRDAHTAVGGSNRGRRYATQQINHAYLVMLSSQFQGFCRDLHSEAVDFLVGRITPPILHLWRVTCGALARAFDQAVGAYLAALLGAPPW